MLGLINETKPSVYSKEAQLEQWLFLLAYFASCFLDIFQKAYIKNYEIIVK